MLNLRVQKTLSFAFTELHALSTTAFAVRETPWLAGASGMEEDADNFCALDHDDPQTYGTETVQ